MALYRITDDKSLKQLDLTSLTDEGLRERSDLQQILRDRPETIEPGLLIIAEEFTNWEDTRRRIDLLALDQEGRLVIIELKRASDEQMDLQALRYAGLVANMTFSQVVEGHRLYLRARNDDRDPEERIRQHLQADDLDADIDSLRPRILLVAEDFPRELTTTVLWLNDVGLDIRCVRILLYQDDAGTLIDVSQIIPLPESRDYLVRVRERVTESEASAKEGKRRARTLKILIDEGILTPETELEVCRDRLSGNLPTIDNNLLRARLGSSPGIQKNIIWKHDGQSYSLSALTTVLRDQHGLPFPSGSLNGYAYWALAADPRKPLLDLVSDPGRTS